MRHPPRCQSTAFQTPRFWPERPTGWCSGAASAPQERCQKPNDRAREAVSWNTGLGGQAATGRPHTPRRGMRARPRGMHPLPEMAARRGTCTSTPGLGRVRAIADRPGMPAPPACAPAPPACTPWLNWPRAEAGAPAPPACTACARLPTAQACAPAPPACPPTPRHARRARTDRPPRHGRQRPRHGPRA